MNEKKTEPQHESLILSNQIVGELRRMTSISEVKEKMDVIKTMQVYFRQTSESMDIQIRAAEAYLVSIRRMGELLIEMAESGQRHDGKGKLSDLQLLSVSVKKLIDIGVSEKLSSECQKLAKIPTEEFYKKIEEAKRIPKPPSKASLLSLADKLGGKQKPKRKREKPVPKEEKEKEEITFEREEPTDELIVEEEKLIEEPIDDFLTMLTDVEASTLELYDSFNILLSYKESMGMDTFIQKFKGYPYKVSASIYRLSSLFEEILNIIPPPEEE